MLMAADTKVLVVHRRLFEKDQSRYFVGRIEGYENGVAKITGRTWARDQYGVLVKKDDLRTKLLALSSGTLIVYQLPFETEIEAIEIESDADGHVVLSDGKTVKMDLTETPHP